MIIEAVISADNTYATVSSEKHTEQIRNLDSSVRVDLDSIFSHLWKNRGDYGIPDATWKDAEMDLNDPDYPECLQYNDFIHSFDDDGENALTVWVEDES